MPELKDAIRMVVADEVATQLMPMLDVLNAFAELAATPTTRTTKRLPATASKPRSTVRSAKAATHPRSWLHARH